MAHALNYAEGLSVEIPASLEAGRLIERFGVQAVYGRPILFLNEIRKIQAATDVSNAVHSKARSESVAKWAEANPGPASILADATKFRDDYDNT